MKTTKGIIPGKKQHVMLMLIAAAMAIFTYAGCHNISAGSKDDNPGQDVDSVGSELKIRSAVEYKNLQIFPITSEKAAQKDVEYLTLSQALKAEKATVHETGNVNQLSITNHSDEYIFIMAGEIVKGGRQDRTMGSDVIIGPKAENVPLESYCVESGRWSPRGEEESAEFSSSSKALSSRELKIASKVKKNQSEVWSNVDKQQNKLNENVSRIKGEQVEVRSAESGSSLQLALENEDLSDIISEYKENLKQLEQLPDNTIGFAYAINGEVYGIDMFNSSELFEQLNSKLFESAIVEAIAEYTENESAPKAGTADVEGLINYQYEHAAEAESINTYTEASIRDGKDAVFSETKQVSNEDKWVHRSYIQKSEESKQQDDRNQEVIQEQLSAPQSIQNNMMIQQYQNRSGR
ncbi:MAG: hypothetical protein JW801_09225 [Bacteroidales bacterium]|nr:hypothetical protein [Bacteroidales bacterium]